MGENARKRLAAASAWGRQHPKATVWEPGDVTYRAEATVVCDDLDAVLADAELGAALRSDRAERVLADALAGSKFPTRGTTQRARAILAALRKGLREPEQPDDETIARVMGKVGRLDVDS